MGARPVTSCPYPRFTNVQFHTLAPQPQEAPLKLTRILPALVLAGMAAATPLAAGRALAAVPAPSSQVIQGQFALQGQQPLTEAHLKITPAPGKPLTEKLDLWMNLPGQPAAIRSYQVEMTKKLHMIFVRDDFKVFLHEHPTLGPDGHLLLTQTFPAPGTYLAYTDGLPNQMNHQVFRFQFDVGQPSPPNRALPQTGLGVQAGPYEVDISSVRLQAGMMSTLDVAILKNGQPATDLHPYLGVPAHAVFLDAQDLTYVHVHPTARGEMMNMDMNDGMKMSAGGMMKDPPPMPENGPSPNALQLHLALREPGTYKMWLQFRGGTQLCIAEFTITVV